MAVNIIKRTWHQNQMVRIEPLNGFAFQAESGGHTFQISGVDDSGNAVPISGTIAGVFLRPDNTDVALTGSASGGVASVTLKAECYAVPGRFLLTVYATSGSNKGTIYAAMGTVSRTSSGVVSPAAASDVVDLVNRINAATATIPASYTTLLNAVATDYSPDATYPKVGTFVWYSGKLYRSKVPITTAETWTAAHWNQVVLSDALNQDITDLKSAIDNVSHRDLLQENAQNEVHVKDESRLAQLENQLDETAIKVDNNSLQIADLVDDLTDTKVKILVNKPGNAYFVNSLGYAFVGNTYTLSDEIRDEFLSQASVPVIIHEASASQVYAANSCKITNLETKQSEAAKNAENNTLRIDDLVQDLTKFKASKCVGNSSVYLADGYGRILARNVYALSDDITADMLESVNKSGYLGVYSRFAFDDWEIPVLRLDGVIPALLAKTANKSIEQSVSAGDPPILYTFMGRSGTIDKMKVQGSSSVKFPKKNYTLTFHDSMVIVDGWERSKKYVVKSNLNDCSQARNACCAKLWGDIAKTRSAAQANDLLIDENENYLVNSVGACLLGIALPPYNIGGNYGAIDGFPILVSINGQYWGLYSFNVPKDKYMASMDGNGTECIVSCGGYSTTNAEYFKGQATMEPDANAVTDFEVEYSHDLTDADVLTSINQAISATMATYDTPQERIETINQYVDINSAMDYFILTALINNTDGVGKNYLLDTWDGVKWYFVPYDMDMVLGNDKWAGTKVGAPTDGLTFSYLASLHRLFYVIYHYDRENFISRYKALRAGALSESNIYKVFGSFVNNIPMAAYDYEGIRWPETPGTSIKTFDQIVNWYRLRCQYLDAEIAALEGTA